MLRAMFDVGYFPPNTPPETVAIPPTPDIRLRRSERRYGPILLQK